MCFGGVLGENIISTLPEVFLFIKWQTINIKWLFVHVCLEISRAYGNGLAMLGSLAMCSVYTSKFTFVQLKLRLGL